MTADLRQELVTLLESRVFDPVLASPSKGFSESDQRVLEQLKRKTEFQKHRYRTYANGAQIRQAFEDDLHSQAGRKIHAALERLGLPSLGAIREEFFEVATRLGIPHVERRWQASDPRPVYLWQNATRPSRRASVARRKSA
jgi:hypothetical protein